MLYFYATVLCVVCILVIFPPVFYPLKLTKILQIFSTNELQRLAILSVHFSYYWKYFVQSFAGKNISSIRITHGTNKTIK